MSYPQEVDDSRLDLIRYLDPAPDYDAGFTYNWTHLTSPEDDLSPYNNRTISVCSQSGAMALFTFEGTRVSVYGSESDQIGDVNNWSSYSINGMSNHTYKSGARGGDHLLLFDSDYMPYGDYTLQIYVGHAEDDAGYSLDYIRYETTSTTAPTSTSQTSSPATPTYSPTLTLSSNTAPSSSPTQTATASSTTSTTQAAVTTSVQSTSSLAKPATIALSTIGGAVGLIGLGLLVLWFKRKRGQYRRIDLTDEIPGEHQGLSPFFSEKGEGRRVLFSASAPPSPAPDSGAMPQAEAASSAVSTAGSRLPPYEPHGALTSDEKTPHLSLVGTTATVSLSSDDEDND
ncbi:hypothetical protein C8T65DRAFT_640193 [Cerioporus squamosus]|nr:hypothetical protein C8T65DRAFT_640193 [Cerioporus squamosus]